MEHPTFYRDIQIDGLSIFYMEAGPKDAPAILLLHGLPSSSRTFEPPFRTEMERLRSAKNPTRNTPPNPYIRMVHRRQFEWAENTCLWSVFRNERA